MNDPSFTCVAFLRGRSQSLVCFICRPTEQGGSWDNSDVKTAKKIEWNADDKKYQPTGYKPSGLDWSGTGPRGSPTTNNKKGTQEPKPKVQKLFGLF